MLVHVLLAALAAFAFAADANNTLDDDKDNALQYHPPTAWRKISHPCATPTCSAHQALPDMGAALQLSFVGKHVSNNPSRLTYRDPRHKAPPSISTASPPRFFSIFPFLSTTDPFLRTPRLPQMPSFLPLRAYQTRAIPSMSPSNPILHFFSIISCILYKNQPLLCASSPARIPTTRPRTRRCLRHHPIRKYPVHQHYRGSSSSARKTTGSRSVPSPVP